MRPEWVRQERATERESEVEPKGFDRETALQSIAERALTLTRATGAAIALSEGNDSEMICVASAGSDAPPVGSRLQVGSGFSGECVRTGRSLRCDDSETDDRVDRAGCKSLGIRSLVAVPIRQGSKVAGLLEVFSPQALRLQRRRHRRAPAIDRKHSYDGSTREGPPAEAQVSSPIQRRHRHRRCARHAARNRLRAKAAAVETERPVTAAKPSSEPSSIQPAATPVRTAQPRSATARSPSQCAKALFVAAIGTFVFALLWLIAPWVSSTMRSSGRTPSHAQAAPAAPKSPNLPANAAAT